MKKKLLELCLSPDLGGLELYMVRAAKALVDDFDVISVINTDGKLQQYYENTDHRYEEVAKKSNLFMFGAAKKIAKIIDDNAIDIVHLHWTKDIPVTVMAKLLSKKRPKLAQTRNMTMTRFKDDFYHRFLYRNIDLMLPVTHQVADQIARFIPETIRPKVEVLYMGSDKPEILNSEAMQAYKDELDIETDEFVIGMVGRIEEAKGQYLLIEAAEELKAEGAAVKVMIVGHAMEASYQEHLQKMIVDKGLEDEIVFLGFTKNPHRFMQACDAVVLATPCETFGLVVIEAMQVGTAVVATNQCGPLEIIEDKRSGLLFENASSRDLADKIKMLYDDRNFCRTLAENGKVSALERFSNEQQFQKLSKILQNL